MSHLAFLFLKELLVLLGVNLPDVSYLGVAVPQLLLVRQLLLPLDPSLVDSLLLLLLLRRYLGLNRLVVDLVQVLLHSSLPILRLRQAQNTSLNQGILLFFHQLLLLLLLLEGVVIVLLVMLLLTIVSPLHTVKVPLLLQEERILLNQHLVVMVLFGLGSRHGRRPYRCRSIGNDLLVQSGRYTIY